MTDKTAIIVAGASGAGIAAQVAAAIGDERHTSVILDLTGPGVPPEIPGLAEIGPGYIFTTSDKDFLGADGGRRFAMLPELGVGYGQDAEIMRAQPDRTDTLPDRVSIERRHKFYDPIVDQLGVKIDGIEQDSVVEYCQSERWARIGERGHDGKLIWEFDHYKSRRVEDVEIEPYWRKPLSRQQRRAREAKMRKAGR